jgi:hypothetical protein
MLSIRGKKKYLLYTFTFLFVFILSVYLACQFNDAWMFLSMFTALVYMCWQALYSCPKCGTPYLYEIGNLGAHPKAMPSKCRKCGEDVL